MRKWIFILCFLVVFAISTGITYGYQSQVNIQNFSEKAPIVETGREEPTENISLEYQIHSLETRTVEVKVTNNTENKQELYVRKSYGSVRYASGGSISGRSITLDSGETDVFIAQMRRYVDTNRNLIDEDLLYVHSFVHSKPKLVESSKTGVIQDGTGGILAKTKSSYQIVTREIGGRTVRLADFSKSGTDSTVAFKKMYRVDAEMKGGYSEYKQVTGFIVPIEYGDKMLNTYSTGFTFRNVFLVKSGVVGNKISIGSTMSHEYVHILQPKYVRDNNIWVTEGMAEYISTKSSYSRTSQSFRNGVESASITSAKLWSIGLRPMGETIRDPYNTGHVDLYQIDQAIQHETNGEYGINKVLYELSEKQNPSYQEFKEVSIEYGGEEARSVFDKRKSNGMTSISASDIVNPYLYYTIVHSFPAPPIFSNILLSILTVVYSLIVWDIARGIYVYIHPD